MSYLVQIIDALVWPAVVLISVFLLRKPLIELIPQLRKLKYRELELEFENDLEVLSQKSQRSRKNRTIEPPPIADEDYYLEQVKELSPRAAIMESWLGLETSAISTAQQFIPSLKNKRVNFHAVLHELRKNEILEEQDIKNIDELRKLRNRSAHELDFSITEEEAAKFMEIARDQTEIIVGEIWGKYGGCRH